MFRGYSSGGWWGEKKCWGHIFHMSLDNVWVSVFIAGSQKMLPPEQTNKAAELSTPSDAITGYISKQNT